jgi:hypothetical protein
MDKTEKRNRALGLLVESILKPDSELRKCSHNQLCFNELMEWKTEVLDYLQKRRYEELGE